jgi:hypothetical protein
MTDTPRSARVPSGTTLYSPLGSTNPAASTLVSYASVNSQKAPIILTPVSLVYC